MALVICNDVFAYLCGFFFGRTPLIQLSPKKTVEGFVGALLCTLVLAFGASSLLMQFDYMICPVQVRTKKIWGGWTFDLTHYFAGFGSHGVVGCLVWSQEPCLQIGALGITGHPPVWHPQAHSVRDPADLDRACPTPCHCHGVFCLSDRSFWWLFCKCCETCLQDQRLWWQYSWSWWYDRSHGLPVLDGLLCPCVLP